jgi:signal transduction histidine kinase
VASAQRGGQIVKDVLRFARRDSQPYSVGDLSHSVKQACRLARPLAEERGVRIHVHPGPGQLIGKFNRTEIEQVVINLVSNAVQASRPGDRVEVDMHREDDEACVLVRDYGHGMRPEEVERIFDPFYTTRENTGGTGLGLSISYGIVQEHAGSIDVQSVPGAGTTVALRLPLDAATKPAQDGTGGPFS